MINAQTLKGFRNFLPPEMALRNRVLETIRQVFTSFGFEPLETPALEYAETILGKYGEEADKLVYQFTDQGERKVALKYDLTVPTAKVIAEFPQITKPFKRYQIQPVWRADKPQKGRYREFVQCDVDTFGSSSPLADAEILAVIYNSLQALNFPDFQINVNSRQALFAIMAKAGIKENYWLSVIQTLDKLDKIGWDNVTQELISEKSLDLSTINSIKTSLEKAKPDDFLKEVMNLALQLGVKPDVLVFNATISRGLDYYTGPIFETTLCSLTKGSITGGGRYDNLIKMFTGQDVPAVGTSLGLDRICDVLAKSSLEEKLKSTTKVLVTVFSSEFLNSSLTVARKLRQQGVNTEVYLEPNSKLDKQLRFADRKGIPFALILGPEEVNQKGYMLKNLDQRTQIFCHNTEEILANINLK